MGEDSILQFSNPSSFRLVQSRHSWLLPNILAAIHSERRILHCEAGGCQAVQWREFFSSADFCSTGWTVDCLLGVFWAVWCSSVHFVGQWNGSWKCGWMIPVCYHVDICMVEAWSKQTVQYFNRSMVAMDARSVDGWSNVALTPSKMVSSFCRVNSALLMK